MNTKIFSTAAILLLATACTTTTTAARRQFQDISVPSGLSYQAGDSIVIESPTVKAAQLVYRGRLEPMTLSDTTLFRSRGQRLASGLADELQGRSASGLREGWRCPRRARLRGLVVHLPRAQRFAGS